MPPKKRHPLEMDALPVPREWAKSAWFKAYNAADSQFYNAAGKDYTVSRHKRDTGETRERALTFWHKYPENRVWKLKMELKEMEEEGEEEGEEDEEEEDEEEEDEEDEDEDEEEEGEEEEDEENEDEEGVVEDEVDKDDDDDAEYEDEGEDEDDGYRYDEEVDDGMMLVPVEEQDGVAEKPGGKGEEHPSYIFDEEDSSGDEAFGFW